MTTTLHRPQRIAPDGHAAPDLVLVPQQPDAPRIVTPPPGPKAKALAERDSRVLSPSYTRPYILAVDRAIGSVVTDVDGNDFLDMTAGIAVTATGHCHPHVVEAIRRQAERCLHMSGTDFYYEPQVQLAERLAAPAPMGGTSINPLPPGEGRVRVQSGAEDERAAPARRGQSNRVFFTNSGAEAVEAALKLARYHTGRKHVIAFYGAFHGRTYGALSLTASKVVQRRGFGPLLPEVSHVTFPNPYRPAGAACVFAADSHEAVGKEASTDRTMAELDELFHRKIPPDEVAAIFVEPIQGEGGYIVPPDGFLPRLRGLCDQHGILLVADEVQTGMGRTGRWWACQHVNVEPDIVAVAKGIASGLPLGAIIARGELMDWPPGAHASTFGGNPVSCAAALATIELLEAGLIDNARRVGDHLLGRLRELQGRFACIGDVRGRGLMVGVELVECGTPAAPMRITAEGGCATSELRDRVIGECYSRGLLLLGCGARAIRFSPPLTVSTRQVDAAAAILAEVLRSC